MSKDTSVPIALTREQLYERVWSTPMTRLAREFGLSDVGLAKICRKHGIPRPPRGHWARLEHGKPVRQATLPDMEDEGLRTVVIDPHHPDPDVGPSTPRRERPEPIPVPEELVDPHPVVAATGKALMRGKVDEWGTIRPKRRCLNLTVSPEALDRALRILQALIGAIEARGGTVSYTTEGPESTVVEVLGEKVSFSIEEAVSRTPREPTPTEKRKMERYSWGRQEELYTYTPTGRLTLQIHQRVAERVRLRWSDSQTRPLDYHLADFVATVIGTAEELRRRRLKWEERERRRQAWFQERDKKLRIIREEEKRMNGLLQEVKLWQRSQQIRRYVREVLERLEGHEQAEQVHKWAVWARFHADRFDPLTPTAPCLLDEKAKWEGYCPY
jgi:hypothetical protein